MYTSGSSTLKKNPPNNQWFAEHIHRYWFVWFSVLYGVFVGLPWLAPLLMQTGAVVPGKIIYLIYSFVCHQLPERSFFLFGQKTMYSLVEIQYRWQQTVDPAILRQYIGDPSTGWKVAWSDRMAALYTSILLFAWLWWPLRKKIRPLHLYGFVLLALPMVVDGASHLISDLSGLNQGFRCTNTWLVTLTQNAFPGWFYYGDALGSFNSWMRLITGTLFGLGVVWFLFPIFVRHIAAEDLLLQAKQGLRNRLLQGHVEKLVETPSPFSDPSVAVQTEDI
jgi:uncharacterized membrane protein